MLSEFSMGFNQLQKTSWGTEKAQDKVLYTQSWGLELEYMDRCVKSQMDNCHPCSHLPSGRHSRFRGQANQAKNKTGEVRVYLDTEKCLKHWSQSHWVTKPEINSWPPHTCTYVYINPHTHKHPHVLSEPTNDWAERAE